MRDEDSRVREDPCRNCGRELPRSEQALQILRVIGWEKMPEDLRVLCGNCALDELARRREWGA